MKVKLLIKEGDSKLHKELIIPELISLLSFKRHILWNKIIIPEMKSKKNMLWNEVIVKKSVGHIVTKNRKIDLLNIDFEKPKYERADDEDSDGYYMLTETKTAIGFDFVMDAKSIELHPMFFDTFIHGEAGCWWCINDSMTGCCLFNSDKFGITSKKDFIIKAKIEARSKVPSQVYDTIINTISKNNGNLLSPRYKFV